MEERIEPWEYTVKVDDKINAKGMNQPNIVISITRRVNDGVDILTMIDDDLNNIIQKTKSSLKKLMEM